MTMVERVARTIVKAAEEERYGPYVGTTDDLTSVLVDGEVDFMLLARAAIEAMREPTEAMSIRGCLVPTEAGGSAGLARYEAAEVWQVMIDAALEEK